MPKSTNLSVGRGEKLSVSQGGGLTAKGRAKYNRATGSKLKAPQKSGSRHRSFCARSKHWKGERGKAARRRWGCRWNLDFMPISIKSVSAFVKALVNAWERQAQRARPPQLLFVNPNELPKSVADDSHYKSLLKAVTWRITGSLDTFVLSWIITGQANLAVTIAFVELFSKIALYWLHERIWLRIKL